MSGAAAEGGVAQWLADHGGLALEGERVVGELAERLVAAGVPLRRVMVALNDVHPEVGARAFRWERGLGHSLDLLPLTARTQPDYLVSPVRLIHDGAAAVRRRIAGPGAEGPLEFPVLEDLKAEGYTDYMAMPLTFSDGSRHFVSWASDAPEGFSTDALTLLYDLMPLICLRMEIAHARVTSRTLLETYLGALAANRILAGRIRRSESEALAAVLLFADMRGFTHQAERLGAGDLVALLNVFYDAIAAPVAAHGGDVVKLVGDGILTVFPIEPEASREMLEEVAVHAAHAAQDADRALSGLAPEELPESVSAVAGGFALGYGPVSFGNVGSRARLDFTVIGPTVNEVVRIETLTKTLGAPILASSAFAALVPGVPLASLGVHVLKGMRAPQEIFSLRPRRG
ncbi:MAG: adenylate/guanylate cyclase domain-containing protein [Alphaproteobacteria bacterium]|nr:adenylate/guanylate cyclase domain-containing protein [Alphaproteobacteria bacterium]